MPSPSKPLGLCQSKGVRGFQRGRGGRPGSLLRATPQSRRRRREGTRADADAAVHGEGGFGLWSKRLLRNYRARGEVGSKVQGAFCFENCTPEGEGEKTGVAY